MLVCEICGSRIVGEGNRIYIEGSSLIVCKDCSDLSKRKKTVRLIRASKLPNRAKVRSSSQKRLPKEEQFTPISDLPKVMVKQRTKLGLSAQDLATRAGIKESLVKKVESGKIILPIQDLRKLERVLKIQLVTISDEEISSEEGAGFDESIEGGLTLGDVINLDHSGR